MNKQHAHLIRSMQSQHTSIAARACMDATRELLRILTGSSTAGASNAAVPSTSEGSLLHAVLECARTDSAMSCASACEGLLLLAAKNALSPAFVVARLLEMIPSADARSLQHIANTLAALCKSAVPEFGASTFTTLSKSVARHPLVAAVSCDPRVWPHVVTIIYETIFSSTTSVVPVVYFALAHAETTTPPDCTASVARAVCAYFASCPASLDAPLALAHVLLDVFSLSLSCAENPDVCACISAITDWLTKILTLETSLLEQSTDSAAISLLSRLSIASCSLLFDPVYSRINPLRLLENLLPLLNVHRMEHELQFMYLVLCNSLLSASITGEIALILQILQSLKSISGAFCLPIAACAMYPLTCIISNPGSSSVKHAAAALMTEISDSLRKPCPPFPPRQFSAMLDRALASPPLNALASHADLLLRVWVETSLQSSFIATPTPDTPFFTCALLFHHDLIVRKNSVTLLSILTSAKNKTAPPTKPTATSSQSMISLKLIPLILFKLKSDPTITLEILQRLIPALVTGHSDPFVTTSVLRIVTALLSNAEAPTWNSNSTPTPTKQTHAITAVGVRALFEIWKQQPRVWPQLKGVLGGYVNQRRARAVSLKRFGKHGDAFDKQGADMEIAVAVTIRDVCQLKPQGHGQDLLPLALGMSEFGECLVATRVLALEVINECIRANITDPRAMWTVHHASYVQKLQESETTTPDQIWIKICEFYALAPEKSEDTEIYQTFKLNILNTHILPMINDNSISTRVRSAAFAALASFVPPDVYPLIGEPLDYMPQFLVNINAPLDGTTRFVSRLISHEVENMRRAVVKALAADMGVGRHALREDESELGGDDACEVQVGKLRRVLKDLAGDLKNSWASGKSAAAVRSGLAAASLFTPVILYDDATRLSSAPDVNAAILSRLPLYKDLVNGLRDMSITDHPVIRLEGVNLWTYFWTQRMGNFGAPTGEAVVPKHSRVDQVEWLFHVSLAELEKRVAEARQPVACANGLFAMTGLISAASLLGLSSSGEQTSRILRLLVTQFARHRDTSGINDLQKSDEVQFAVCLCLANISKLLFPTDEESFEVILGQLELEIELTQSADAQSIFAAGYGLATVLQALVLSPSPISHRIKTLSSTVIGHLVNPAIKPVFNGLAIGFSACLGDLREDLETEEEGGSILRSAIAAIQDRFLSGNSDTISGDCWIISAAVACKVSHDVDVIVARLDAIIDEALVEPNLHSDLAHARMALHRILVVVSSDRIPATLEETISAISRQGIPSFDKVSRALSLIPLLGLESGVTPVTTASSYREKCEALYKQFKSQDPKIGRILGWVLGKLFSAYEVMFEPPAQETMLSHSGRGGNAFTTSRRKDPVDYRRLNAGSSFLRAVFDSLTALLPDFGGGEKSMSRAQVLLGGILNVAMQKDKPVTLPLVNWIRILTACTEHGNFNLRRDAFLLASAGSSATGAKSLVDFFVLRMSAFEEDDVVRKYCFGLEGVGKLLKLAGVAEKEEVRGDDGNVESAAVVTVAPSKVYEIIAKMIFFGFSKGDESEAGLEWMIELCETLWKGLNIDLSGSSAVVLKLRSDILSLLCDTYLSFTSTATSQKSILLIRRLIKAAMTLQSESSIQLLTHLLTPSEWSPKSIWAILHVLEFTGYKDDSAQVSWIDACVREKFVHRDHLFVRVLQHVFAQPMTSLQPYKVHDAVLTYMRHLAIRNGGSGGSGSGSGEDGANIGFRLSWIIKYLDVLIIACASGSGKAVDAGWSAFGGVSGAVVMMDTACRPGVAFGMTSEAGSDQESEVIMLREEHSALVEGFAEHVFQHVVVVEAETGDKDIVSLQNQIAKRLIRLMECSTTTRGISANKKSTRDGAGQAARVLIEEKTRVGIRNALVRMKSVSSVEESWDEVVGTL
ncbi:hypothetical protein HDU81_009664 [Chytriomyces hyalinus]|nr:hypothetical protein HDU81_009664 [Chytriomyces hyalinus]